MTVRRSSKHFRGIFQHIECQFTNDSGALGNCFASIICFQLITYSHQKLGCLKSAVNNFSAVSSSINRGLSTPLLRQLKFSCECGIRLSAINTQRYLLYFLRTSN